MGSVYLYPPETKIKAFDQQLVTDLELTKGQMENREL